MAGTEGPWARWPLLEAAVRRPLVSAVLLCCGCLPGRAFVARIEAQRPGGHTARAPRAPVGRLRGRRPRGRRERVAMRDAESLAALSLADDISIFQLLVAVVAAVVAYGQSDEYKISRATEEMLRPYSPELPGCRKSVDRLSKETFKRRVSSWSGHATILAGLYESGKSTIVQYVLDGQPGVVRTTVGDDSWQEKLCTQVGVQDEGMLKEVLKRVRKGLDREVHLSSVPVVVLDVPRDSEASIRRVSTFAKDFSSDTTLAHVMVCASSATSALGFDAGGENRRFDIWVGDLRLEEALSLLEGRGIAAADAMRLVEEVGRNPGCLQGCASQLLQGASLQEVVERRRAFAAEQVRGLHAIVLKDNYEKPWPVGLELTKAILDSERGQVSHGRWIDKGIKVKDVAREIKSWEAHAVFFHSTDKVWRFSSPAHRRAAAARHAEPP